MSTQYHYSAYGFFGLARVLIVAVLIVGHLIHTVILTVLHNTLINALHPRGYIGTPMVSVAVFVMHFCVLVKALQLCNKISY
jgi:hypothetical protein